MNDLLDRAMRLWARGLSIIPVPAPRPGVPDNCPGGGKVPAITWGQYQTRLPDEEEVRTWFAREAVTNIGVVTGAVSGVIVIDGDTPDAVAWLTLNLKYTPWQTKTAKGFHLWYRHPGVRVPNRARVETRDGRLAIDVRGDGGYVIAPGSIHASGIRYLEAGDWTDRRERMPVFWPGWLQRPRSPVPPVWRDRQTTGDIVDRARRYLAKIPRPEIECGSDIAVLFAACRLVRGFALSEGEAVELLWDWAGGRPGWTREWIAAKVRHALRYGTEPIGAYR